MNNQHSSQNTTMAILLSIITIVLYCPDTYPAEDIKPPTNRPSDKDEIRIAIQRFLNACRRHDLQSARLLNLYTGEYQEKRVPFPAVDGYEILSIDETRSENAKFSEAYASENAFADTYVKSDQSFRGANRYILRKQLPRYEKAVKEATAAIREDFGPILARYMASGYPKDYLFQITDTQRKIFTKYGAPRIVDGITLYSFNADLIATETLPELWVTLESAMENTIPKPGLLVLMDEKEDFLFTNIVEKIVRASGWTNEEAAKKIDAASYRFDHTVVFCRLDLIDNEGLIRKQRVHIGMARLRLDSGEDTGWLLVSWKKLMENTP